MDTTLSSPNDSLQRDAATASGATGLVQERSAAGQQHADAPTLTDEVVDGLASDASDASHGIGRALQEAISASDEWLDAGRTVVRANPLLALGGAALVGIALSLATSRAARR